MIDWTTNTRGTSRDWERTHQRNAIRFLNDATDIRIAYDAKLQDAIRTFGDRHTPTWKIAGLSPDAGCDVCRARGVVHTEHERLNHQTGSAIAGIYADHFPDTIKTELRQGLNALRRCLDEAATEWRASGRQTRTFCQLAKLARQLPDGRESYY